jgi:DNA-binding NarL/FixJ family response regulator
MKWRLRHAMKDVLKTSPKSLKVLLTDDQPKTRRALRALLTTYPDIDIVADCGDGAQAVALANQLHPDVVVLDYRMPEMDGLEATRRIKDRWPDIGIVVLTMHPDVESQAKAARADAFLLKGCAAADLVSAVLKAGGQYRGRRVTRV